MAVLDLAHTENLELANLIAEKARLEALKMLDGVVEGEYVSIKPHTYKKTIESGKETIDYRIIYYKNTKKGLVVS